MLSVFQAIIIGLLQGVTELFPISSLGHSVILPSLLGWHIQQGNKYFLTFLVATHLATALVLFFFFLGDWIKILQGLWRMVRTRKITENDTYARLGALLIVATIPAGILGLLLEKKLRSAFATAKFAALLLIVNALILFAADYLQKRIVQRRERNVSDDQKIARLSFKQAIGIGLAQAAALMPGISRSGSSMTAGLMSGLNYENAARFSFLLATPVIGAAAVLKLPDLLKPDIAPMRTAIIVGALCAALTAYISVKFLLKYFETRTLKPFAIYCLIAGVLLTIYFSF